MTDAKLEMLTGHVQGYGSQGYDWCRFVWNNRELSYKTGDRFSLGRWSVPEEQKWQKHIDDGTIAEQAKNKKLAFHLCSNCHEPCNKGRLLSWRAETVCSDECLEQAQYKFYMRQAPCDHSGYERPQDYRPTSLSCFRCGCYWTKWPEGRPEQERYYV